MNEYGSVPKNFEIMDDTGTAVVVFDPPPKGFRWNVDRVDPGVNDITGGELMIGFGPNANAPMIFGTRGVNPWPRTFKGYGFKDGVANTTALSPGPGDTASAIYAKCTGTGISIRGTVSAHLVKVA